MSSSESSLSPSPSRVPSPAASYHGPPGLEQLIEHFVSAKTSLNSTAHVFRADELVKSARTLIEEIAVLNARNTYARNALAEQVGTLDVVRDTLGDDGDRVADEFSATLAKLDKAHLRLDRTLKTLRKTVVRATTPRRLDQHAGEEQTEAAAAASPSAEPSEKTLYDFIDESTHEHLLSALRGLIDDYHDARAELDGMLRAFDQTVSSICEKFSCESPEDSGPIGKKTIYDEPPLSLEQLFRGMEEHATEMASLLENLVKHYDLCVTALKHTEGGGEAARRAVQSTDLARSNNSSSAAPGTAEESLYGATVAAPISDQERTEMLFVVAADAREVDDVATEIGDRAAALSAHHEQLARHAQRARLRRQALRQAVDLLRAARSALPNHVESAARFVDAWREIARSARAQTTDLADLSVFYEQFLSGYRELLREVERRRQGEEQMRRVAERARRELEKLRDADRKARSEFMEEVGGYLPRDLAVWHGLDVEPTRWEVRSGHAEMRFPDDDDDDGNDKHGDAAEGVEGAGSQPASGS